MLFLHHCDLNVFQDSGQHSKNIVYSVMDLSQPIIANANPFWPYVAKCSLDPLSPCVKHGTVGKNIDLFRLILGSIIGFKNISFVLSPSNVSSILSEKFGYNAGLFQPLINQEINASASLVYMDDDVEKIRSMDFSLPIAAIKRGMVFRADVISEVTDVFGPLAALRAFDKDVLPLLFLVFVCIKRIS